MSRQDEVSRRIQEVMREAVPDIEFAGPVVGAKDIFLPVYPDNKPKWWQVCKWFGLWLGLWRPKQFVADWVQAPWEIKCSQHEGCRLVGNLFIPVACLRDTAGDAETEMVERIARGNANRALHTIAKHRRSPRRRQFFCWPGIRSRDTVEFQRVECPGRFSE